MRKILLNMLMGVAVLFAASNLYGQIIPEKNYDVTGVQTKDLPDKPKKLYLKNFKVFYQMIAEAEKTNYGGRQLGGGSYTGDATARLAVGVEGIEPEDLQSLTDEIYTRYVDNLKSLGYEIVTNDDLGNPEFFEDWEILQGPRINEAQVKGSLMVVPSGYSYYVKGVNKKGKEKTGGFMAGVTGDATGFGSAIYGPVAKLSKDIDDVMVVEVVINIPSIWLDPKTKLGGAKVKGGPYLRLQNGRATYVSGESSKPGAPYADTGVEVILTKEVPINGVFKSEEFKAVADKSRTSVPSYGAFFTVDNTTMELTNTIECDAEIYKEEVGKTINAFLDLSLEKLKLGLQGEKVK